ncbi:hypothetical protein ACH3VR_13520 [Microbacterium sp. B2969]|uniref:BACON domain-containing protein n=1 Tax=Microbacterium alkaliflavum TaxID=3248839 RepID=A0ABW7Q9P5_9MICO
MSGAEGFGPEGEAGAESAPFAVSGPAALTLDQATRKGTASFTVSNVTGRPVRVRLAVQAGAGTDAAWFAIAGDAERPLPVAGTATVDVAVTVPDPAAAGSGSFTLGAALEEEPDEVVPSPTVSFEIPPSKRKPFPWWIVIVVIVALVLLGGGGILIWTLTRPGAPEPSPTSTPTPTSTVFLSDDFLVDTSSKSVDLDGDGAADVQVDDADLGPAIPADRPTTVFGVNRGVAIVDQPTREACRAVVLESSVQIAQDASGVFVCVFTSGEHSGILEFGPTLDDETRKVLVTLWE